MDQSICGLDHFDSEGDEEEPDSKRIHQKAKPIESKSLEV